jgi:hypothetical protein
MPQVAVAESSQQMPPVFLEEMAERVAGELPRAEQDLLEFGLALTQQQTQVLAAVVPDTTQMPQVRTWRAAMVDLA